MSRTTEDSVHSFGLPWTQNLIYIERQYVRRANNLPVHIMRYNEVNIRSHSNDYNWRTIYHLANDCNDTFTLIRLPAPLFTLLCFCCRLSMLPLSLHMTVVCSFIRVLYFNSISPKPRILFINLANRKRNTLLEMCNRIDIVSISSWTRKMVNWNVKYTWAIKIIKNNDNISTKKSEVGKKWRSGK